MAQGEVTVPNDLDGGLPIRFAMERLVLQPVHAPGAADARGTRSAQGLRRSSIRRRRLRVAAAPLRAAGGEGRQGSRRACDSPSSTATVARLHHRRARRLARGGRRVRGRRLAIELTSSDLGATSSALDLPGAIEAKHANATANLTWPGGPTGDIVAHMNGTVELALDARPAPEREARRGPHARAREPRRTAAAPRARLPRRDRCRTRVRHGARRLRDPRRQRIHAGPAAQGRRARHRASWAAPASRRRTTTRPSS